MWNPSVHRFLSSSTPLNPKQNQVSSPAIFSSKVPTPETDHLMLSRLPRFAGQGDGKWQTVSHTKKKPPDLNGQTDQPSKKSKSRNHQGTKRPSTSQKEKTQPTYPGNGIASSLSKKPVEETRVTELKKQHAESSSLKKSTTLIQPALPKILPRIPMKEASTAPASLPLSGSKDKQRPSSKTIDKREETSSSEPQRVTQEEVETLCSALHDKLPELDLSSALKKQIKNYMNAPGNNYELGKLAEWIGHQDFDARKAALLVFHRGQPGHVLQRALAKVDREAKNAGKQKSVESTEPLSSSAKEQTTKLSEGSQNKPPSLETKASTNKHNRIPRQAHPQNDYTNLQLSADQRTEVRRARNIKHRYDRLAFEAIVLIKAKNEPSQDQAVVEARKQTCEVFLLSNRYDLNKSLDKSHHPFYNKEVAEILQSALLQVAAKKTMDGRIA
jgi:hypothetical protein